MVVVNLDLNNALDHRKNNKLFAQNNTNPMRFTSIYN